MKSATLPSFWKEYAKLDAELKKRARKIYQLWAENPFHPSLRFKCVNQSEGFWSVRITRGIRAVGMMNDDTVVWFWIGSHNDYEAFSDKFIRYVALNAQFVSRPTAIGKRRKRDCLVQNKQ